MSGIHRKFDEARWPAPTRSASVVSVSSSSDGRDSPLAGPAFTGEKSAPVTKSELAIRKVSTIVKHENLSVLPSSTQNKKTKAPCPKILSPMFVHNVAKKPGARGNFSDMSVFDSSEVLHKPQIRTPTPVIGSSYTASLANIRNKVHLPVAEDPNPLTSRVDSLIKYAQQLGKPRTQDTVTRPSELPMVTMDTASWKQSYYEEKSTVLTSKPHIPKILIAEAAKRGACK